MQETLMQLDQIRLNFSTEGRQLLNLTIAFLMFGVALELKVADFVKLFKQPKSAFVGIISQFILMPLLTFLLALSVRDYITPTVGLGMILVAACPGGNISNFLSSLSKGNVALSVSLTAFSSFAALILTPLNFSIWGGLFLKFYTNNTGLIIPGLEIDLLSVLETIIILLGIPLILGILFSTKFPKTTAKILITIKRVSILSFFGMVVVIFSKNYDYFILYIQYIFLIVLVHNALALATGYYAAKWAGLNLQDRKTISIETGIQNSGLALALLFNPRIFPESIPVGGMAFIAAWWGVWHILSGLTIAGIWTGFSLKSAKPADTSN